jgi:hypothetical protein
MKKLATTFFKWRCVIHHYAESKATLPVRTGFIADLYFGFHLATSLVISICDGI